MMGNNVQYLPLLPPPLRTTPKVPSGRRAGFTSPRPSASRAVPEGGKKIVKGQGHLSNIIVFK